MTTKRLLLQEGETGINYSLLVSEDDYDRALTDKAFAYSLLFHARVTNSVENKENENVNEQEPVDGNHNDEDENVINDDRPSCSTSEEGVVGSFSVEATKLFLALWLKRKDKFRDPSIRKKKLFEEIAEQMRKHKYTYSIQDIERKYRNMKQYYVSIKDHNNKTGRGRKSWPYYELVAAILACDNSINPPALMSSMGFSHQQTEGVKDDVATITEPPSGFDIITQRYPTTEMLPEVASVSDVREAVKKRRLNAKKGQSNNVHVKRVRKSLVVSQEALAVEEERNNELRLLRTTLEKQNDIQTRRNDLLEQLLNAQRGS